MDEQSHVNELQDAMDKLQIANILPDKHPSLKYWYSLQMFRPHKLPKKTFRNYPEFCHEQSMCLYFEETESQLEYERNFIDSQFLTPRDFQRFTVDSPKKFTVDILMNLAFLKRYELLLDIDGVPFSKGNYFALVFRSNQIWFCKCISKEVIRGDRVPNHVLIDQTLELSFKTCNFNRKSLPEGQKKSFFKIYPLSTPTSRMLRSMYNLSSQKLQNLLIPKDVTISCTENPAENLTFINKSLNMSQQVAIKAILQDEVTVIQGPPGTGKTTVIEEAINQLINRGIYPIVVCAASNAAVDTIAMKFVSAGATANCLRVLSSAQEPVYTDDHPLKSICLHLSILTHMSSSIVQILRCIWANKKVSPNEHKNAMMQRWELSERALLKAKIIFATIPTLGRSLIANLPRVGAVIIDEATQASAPSIAIPLCLNEVQKFVFVGDQKQLGCIHACKRFSKSHFERLISHMYHGVTPLVSRMLDVQYRMHPDISHFPRNTFYNGELKDGVSKYDKERSGLPSNPVIFWNSNEPESLLKATGRNPSWINYKECRMVTKVIEELKRKGVKNTEIGVVTPYSGQKYAIADTLKSNHNINPNMELGVIEQKAVSEGTYNHGSVCFVSDIMIASIDAFQGKEKEVMIFSCVRSNNLNKIGFLSCPRRINVALTRAKMCLILIGNSVCLRRSGPTWRQYIEHLKKKNSIKEGFEFELA